MWQDSKWTGVASPTISRMLMTRLWRGYSAGGVSLGRSLRSCLLEAVIRLIPPVSIGESINADNADETELEVEAEIRIKSGFIPETQMILFLELPFIPDWHLLCLLMRELVVWYEKDQEAEWPLVYERKIAELIWRLMSGPKYVEQFALAYPDIKEVLFEADDRYFVLTQEESR